MEGLHKLYDLRGKRVFVAGHKGMVGSAILRRLEQMDCEILVATKSQCDLRSEDQVDRFLHSTKPHAVFLAAGKVGGIQANRTMPVDFIADNLAIAKSVISAAHKYEVEKLLYLGSSCIYPKMASQPMTEEMLLSGPLEPTNQWYAVAKIAGIKLCEAYRLQYGADFISAMPTNLYGPGDNYHPENSHVPAALLRRFHDAAGSRCATATVWGTGSPRREFLAVDDLADACLFLMEHYSDLPFVNVGTGQDITIGEFARIIADLVGFSGNIVFDSSRPDGAPRKLLDVSRINALGWHAKIPLNEGLRQMYADFLARLASGEYQVKEGAAL
jgi:GDP-L-fucose synthase